MRWAAAGGELRPGHVGEAVGGQESPPPRPFTKSPPPRFAEPPSGWGRPSTSHPLGCSAPALAGGGRKGGGGGGSKGGRPICGDADWLWRAEKDRGGVGAREAQRIRHETLGALSARLKCVSSAWKRRRSHFVGEETLPSSHLLI